MGSPGFTRRPARLSVRGSSVWRICPIEEHAPQPPTGVRSAPTERKESRSLRHRLARSMHRVIRNEARPVP